MVGMVIRHTSVVRTMVRGAAMRRPLHAVRLKAKGTQIQEANIIKDLYRQFTGQTKPSFYILVYISLVFPYQEVKLLLAI
jgi:hypothetical protein